MDTAVCVDNPAGVDVPIFVDNPAGVIAAICVDNAAGVDVTPAGVDARLLFFLENVLTGVCIWMTSVGVPDRGGVPSFPPETAPNPKAALL